MPTDQDDDTSTDSLYRTVTKTRQENVSKLHAKCPVENSVPPEWTSKYKPIKNCKMQSM